MDEDEPIAASPLRSLAAGGMAAALSVACLHYAWFPTLERIPPIYARFYDRDRPGLESTIRTLESAGNYGEAAEVIQERLAHRMSAGWKAVLVAGLYRDLTQAGRRCSDPVQRVTYFTRACAVARGHGLDDQFATTLLAQAARTRDFVQRIEALRAQKQWPEVVSDLRAALKEQPSPEGGLLLPARLHEALVAWGTGSQNLEQKAQRLREAIDVARRYGLESETTAALLRAVEEEMARGADLERRVRQLQGEGRWSELIALIGTVMEERSRPAGSLPWEQWLFEAHYRWGTASRTSERGRSGTGRPSASRTRSGSIPNRPRLA